MRKLAFLATFSLFLSLATFAQVPVALSPVPRMQFLDPNGHPLAGGKVFFYNAGTSTPAPTYVDANGVILNANPVILDSGGFGTIYLAAQSYKVCVQDLNSIPQWCQDQVSAFQILLNAQSIILAGTTVDPAGVAGQLGYRTDLGRVRFFNSAWDSLIGANTVDVLANKTLTSPVENSPTETTPIINGVPMAAGPGTYQLFPNTGAGTTINLLAKLSSAPSGAIVPAITDTGGVVGICVAGCGAAGTAQIQESGNASCVVDNASVAGDYLQISSTVSGNCHDVGNSFPTSGQVIGRVLTTAVAGLQPINLFGPEVNPKSPSSNLALLTIANAGVVGTAVNQLVKLTGAPSTAVTITTADTTGIVGICTANCGIAGNATVQLSGPVSCLFDVTGSTAGDYVVPSPTIAGSCRDAGSIYPSGRQVIGRVLTTNVGNGTYAIDLFPSEISPPPTIQQSSITALGGDVVLVATTVTPIITKAVTMPSFGCPCRAFVGWELGATTSNPQGIEGWVNDGTNNFATGGMNTTGSVGPPTQFHLTASSYSTGTYANGAVITFTLKVEAEMAMTIRAASEFSPQGSWLNVAIQTSN